MSGDRGDPHKDVADARAGLMTSFAGMTLAAAAGNGPAGTAVGALAGPALMLVRSTLDRARDTREARAEVIEAAVRTPLQAKIEALAEVLAEGLQTDGAAHRGKILAAVLADIEAPHIAVLGFLRDTPVPPENLRRPNHPEPRGWEAPQIGQALPQLGTVLDNLVAGPVRSWTHPRRWRGRLLRWHWPGGLEDH